MSRALNINNIYVLVRIKKHLARDGVCTQTPKHPNPSNVLHFMDNAHENLLEEEQQHKFLTYQYSSTADVWLWLYYWYPTKRVAMLNLI